MGSALGRGSSLKGLPLLIVARSGLGGLIAVVDKLTDELDNLSLSDRKQNVTRGLLQCCQK